MMKHRNSDPELREGLPKASRGAELRERLPTDEGDLKILDASIQDRVRSCSRKTKVLMKDGLMSTRACHTFPSFFQVDWVLVLENLRIPLQCQNLFRSNSVEFVSAEACEFFVPFLRFM